MWNYGKCEKGGEIKELEQSILESLAILYWITETNVTKQSSFENWAQYHGTLCGA